MKINIKKTKTKIALEKSWLDGFKFGKESGFTRGILALRRTQAEGGSYKRLGLHMEDYDTAK